jgi:hypothetical protein
VAIAAIAAHLQACLTKEVYCSAETQAFIIDSVCKALLIPNISYVINASEAEILLFNESK